MSYGGFEYNQGGFGGFDVMSGFGGGDMGGGFMGNQDGPKSAEKKSNRDKSSLIPVTIKQLTNATRDASTDTYQIDNADLATVRIMGLVETVEEHATNCNYRINDGTGILECKYWIEKDSSGSRHTKINEFTYVRVDGSLRDYEGRKHLFVYSIKKIENWNEMTHHFLDVILVHLQHTRGPIPGSKSSTTAGVASPSSYSSPFSHAPTSFTGGMMGSNLPVGRNLNSAINDAGNKSGVKEKILKVFDQFGHSLEGLSIQEATMRLQGDGLSFEIISRTIQYLTDEGLLYTTIDENHFKTTERREKSVDRRGKEC